MKNLVTATLLASQLTPGQPGWLAVEYAIADGWHIYWENPGDTGIPTEVNLSLPAGVTAEAPRYPGPHRFMMPGDLTNYGYEDRVTLLIPVRAESWGGTVAAETRWLVCREEQCLPGKATLSLDLSKATPTDLSAHIAALPAPLPGTAKVSRATGALTIEIPEARQVEVFPNPALEEVLERAEVQGGTARLVLKRAAPGGAAAVLRIITAEGAERYYRVPVEG